MTSLDALVDAIDKQFSAGVYEAAMSLIERNLAEAWYGFRPERFREMLGTIIEAGADKSGAGRWFHTALSPAHEQPHQPGEHPLVLDNPALPVEILMRIAQIAELRFRGQARQALCLLDELDARPRAVQPIFDTNSGWDLLISVQNGITAMLAGEFRRALGYFSEAELHVPVSTLTFLNRDAHIKAALLHALVGDTEAARTSLGHAKEIPRTSSWAETLIDANEAWVSALLEPDSDEAVRALLAVPPRDVGEMWPFYALTVQRVFFRAGRSKELGERIATLEKIPFPRQQGEGLTGSVFSMIRAQMCLSGDDVNGAMWHLDNADDSLLHVRLLEAQIEYHAARYPRAMSTARGLLDDVNGLRQLEMWRHAIMASSQFELNRPDAVRESLKAARELSGQIRVEDLHYFSNSVLEFAREHLENWYLDTFDDAVRQGGYGAEPSVQLTDREREILRLLGQASSRAEIADQLFVSLNTLKSHLRKIYRKLGVSTRDAAILRAEREGLL